MAVDLHQGHVVLPHLPDWQGGVSWSRSWDTRVETAEDGTEHRQGLRPKPRHSLRFSLRSVNQAEFNRLLARLREAARTGLVAVPFWGRALRLTSDASGSGVNVEALAWPLAVGDALFFRQPAVDAFEAWELARIDTVIDRTITLAARLSRTYPAGGYCWPLLLGEYRGKDLDLHTDWHASVACEVRQLAVTPDAPVWEDICFSNGSCETWNNFGAGELFHYVGLRQDEACVTVPAACWTSAWLGRGFTTIGALETWENLTWTNAASNVTRPGTSEAFGGGSLAWVGEWLLTALPPWGGLDAFESLPAGAWAASATVTTNDVALSEHQTLGWALPPVWRGESF